MAWFNEEIAGLLREYAELTQITGGDVFRARNYEKAARSVRGWADDIGQLDVTALRAIPGVGASIAAKIAEYRESGSIRALDELRAKIPPGVLELTRVPGLGPKRALQLNRDLGVQSVDDLAAAIKEGRLDGLAGFGAKSGCCSTWRCARRPRWWTRSPRSASAAPTRARCAGGGRPSVTSTSSPRPTTRRR